VSSIKYLSRTITARMLVVETASYFRVIIIDARLSMSNHVETSCDYGLVKSRVPNFERHGILSAIPKQEVMIGEMA